MTALNVSSHVIGNEHMEMINCVPLGITRDREWFEDDYMAFSSIVYHTRDKPWSDAKEFTYMYGYRYEVDDDCRMAATQTKDIMSEQGLEVSSDEEWEDEDEDKSAREDTDEEICPKP
ncbi:hypothetical protein FAGAP_4933 [Fusarium agapanthi]|uniref:Uncharacterized protein n=1 Tax=Fusarium agapanthi TaxID=1803897 RepID=A0A9P5E7E0_9HYPO|nr:hypothetical protein FAGAP_4933 [Fusarium agapanthi]